MKSRGFSLLEALFAMLITFMVLGAVTYILQQSLSTEGSLEELGALSELNHAFNRIRTDVAGEFSLSKPTGATGNMIVLSEVDPSLTLQARLASGTPFGPSQQVTVQYLWDAQRGLVRQVFNQATLTDDRALLSCSSFQTGLTGSNLLWVKLDIVYKRVTKTFALELVLPR